MKSFSDAEIEASLRAIGRQRRSALPSRHERERVLRNVMARIDAADSTPAFFRPQTLLFSPRLALVMVVILAASTTIFRKPGIVSRHDTPTTFERSRDQISSSHATAHLITDQFDFDSLDSSANEGAFVLIDQELNEPRSTDAAGLRDELQLSGDLAFPDADLEFEDEGGTFL